VSDACPVCSGVHAGPCVASLPMSDLKVRLSSRCFECGHDLTPPICPACAPESVDQAELARLKDKVEGLTADLYLAVETAYCRGAKEWTRLNYPEWFGRLETLERAPSVDYRGRAEQMHRRAQRAEAERDRWKWEREWWFDRFRYWSRRAQEAERGARRLWSSDQHLRRIILLGERYP
jgi:hypothetical protein